MTRKFICNSMLGRLCKFLRMCGIDSKYCKHSKDIVVTSRKENRIILTKNTKLRGKPHVFFIEADDPEQQLDMVIQNFQLASAINLFSRCLICNGLLTPVEKNKIRDRVPYYTYNSQSQFYICAQCDHVYWPGSHYENMLKKLSRLKKSRELKK